MEGAPRKRRLIGEINVVPLIDVMLVLLVIFMATAPLLTQGVKVELPTASTEPLETNPEPPLVLTIDREGQRFLDGAGTGQRSLADDELQQAVRAALEADPKRDVQIRADRSVDYGRVFEAMALLQKAGAASLGFLSDPPPDGGARP